MKPAKVDGLDRAFGGNMKQLLPDYATIPKEFKDFNRETWGGKLFSELFYKGGSVAHLKPKEGIEKAEAISHIQAIMSSWEPKHEHKTAACAYLFDLWFHNPTEAKPATT